MLSCVEASLHAASQDIEKWRAREATGVNFLFLYLYKTVAGLYYYHVRLPHSILTPF